MTNGNAAATKRPSESLGEYLKGVLENQDLPDGLPVAPFKAFINAAMRCGRWPGQAVVVKPDTLLVEFCPGQSCLHIESLAEALENNLRALINYGDKMPAYAVLGTFDDPVNALMFSEVIQQIRHLRARLSPALVEPNDRDTSCPV